MAHFHTLFQSESICIAEFRCNGATPREPREECTPTHEIVLPRRGLFIRRDSRGTAVGDINQTIFFNAGQPYQVSHPAPGGDLCTILCLNKSILMEMIRSLDPSVDGRPEFPFPTGHSIVSTGQRLAHFQLLRRLSQGKDHDPLEIEERAVGLADNVIRSTYDLLGRLSTPQRPATCQFHHDIVDRARILLNERFAEKLSLYQISRSVHCSPFHLSRVFRNLVGIPIHRYLQRIRLFTALERVPTRSTTVTDLAYALGFSSHSHFTTAFKQEFGFPPSLLTKTPSPLRVSRN